MKGFLSLCLVCSIVAVAFLPFLAGAETETYFIYSEGITKGSSTGFTEQFQRDSVYETKTESNNGTATVGLIPDADVSIGWEYVGGSGLTDHYEALSQTGEPDDNTSYLTSTGSPLNYDRLSLSNSGLASTTVIVSVEAFAVARMNGTTNTFIINLTDPSGHCVEQAWAGIGQEFTNLTKTYTLSCDSDAWTVADLNGLNLIITAGGAQATTVTFAGVIVTYQTNYWLDITDTINVPAEQVKSVRVVAEGQVGGDGQGFNLQVGTHVETGCFVNPKEHVEIETPLKGPLPVRIYQNPDTTQSSLELDWLVAFVELETGGGMGDSVRLYCKPGIWNMECAAQLDFNVTGVLINETQWYIDDVFKGYGIDTGNGRMHYIDMGYMVFQKRAHVHVVISFSNGQVFHLDKFVDVDNSWVLLIAALVTVFILLGIGYIVLRRREKRTKRVVVRPDPYAETRMQIIERTRRP